MISRFLTASVLVGSLSFASAAMAQRAAPNPAVKTGAPATDMMGIQNSKITNTGAKRTGGLSAMDKNFIENAGKGRITEVEWGKVATEKGQSAEVKRFGQQMVADHSKINNELKALAAKIGVGLPNKGPKTSWKSDKKYMGMMVKEHEQDLAEFQQEARSSSDPDVKRFADKTSRLIQKHLAMAKEIDGKLK